MVSSLPVLSRPYSGGVGWVAAQLADSAASARVSLIERDLLVHVPTAELFFPAVAEDDLPSPLHPLSAYAFARAATPLTALFRLERSRYVETLLRDGKTPAIISDMDLQRSLRVKVRASAYEVGQRVLLLSGDWSGIDGRICEVKPGLVRVYIELRSVATVVTAPYHEVQLL